MGTNTPTRPPGRGALFAALVIMMSAACGPQGSTTPPTGGDDDATAGDDDSTPDLREEGPCRDPSAVPDDSGDCDGDGFTEGEGDCDDTDLSRRPSALELPNGVDDDCDGLDDEGYGLDDDGDGYVDHDREGGDDCDDLAADTHPGAPEACDGLDNDCDGALPGEELDGDGDAVTPCQGDCDDAAPQVAPGQEDPEGDGADKDCDGFDGQAPVPCPFESRDVLGLEGEETTYWSLTGYRPFWPDLPPPYGGLVLCIYQDQYGGHGFDGDIEDDVGCVRNRRFPELGEYVGWVGAAGTLYPLDTDASVPPGGSCVPAFTPQEEGE